MSAPLWVTETAERFWAAAGEPEPFPRSLRRAALNALPLGIVLLPRLRLEGIRHWLERQGVSCALETPDRPLRACLVTRFGHGLVFLDGADPEDEQRFSLAHELAHFLQDCDRPRRLVAERLGPAALEVLDGLRPPRPEERAHALLAGVALRAQVHLMERTPDGHLPSARITAAERSADRLAFELLAPATELLPAGPGRSGAPERRQLVARLVGEYGLPPVPAQQYAALLAPAPAPVHPLLQRLRPDARWGAPPARGT